MRRALFLLPLVLAGCGGHKLAQCGGDIAPFPAIGRPVVWDDGQSTFMRFAGNQRIPVPYVVLPDGKEAVIDRTVIADGSDHIVMLPQTAKEIRLRDGDAVACIVNNNWTPAGRNPGTGTTSPNIVRVLKESAR